MKEFWFGEGMWNQRRELFDWCEATFGPHGRDCYGTQRWVFFSDGEASPQLDKRVHLYLNEVDAAWFLLRWA